MRRCFCFRREMSLSSRRLSIVKKCTWYFWKRVLNEKASRNENRIPDIWFACTSAYSIGLSILTKWIVNVERTIVRTVHRVFVVTDVCVVLNSCFVPNSLVQINVNLFNQETIRCFSATRIRKKTFRVFFYNNMKPTKLRMYNEPVWSIRLLRWNVKNSIISKYATQSDLKWPRFRGEMERFKIDGRRLIRSQNPIA